MSFKTAAVGTGKLVSAFGMLHCIREYLVDFQACEGASMSPAIPEEGSVLIIDKLTPRIFGYSKGDVIISKSPRGAYMVCKRISAIAGEAVTIGRRSLSIPEGHVWLLGDNGPRSVDSLMYGPVPLPLLSGRVRMTLWPLPSFVK